MGYFRVSLELPFGWMVYVERGEIVYYNSPEGVRFFSKEDVFKHLTEINKVSYFGQSILDAIYKGENEKVSKLLVGVDAAILNKAFVSEWFYGQPLFPLQAGCMINNMFAVKKLLEIPGIDVNVKNQDGMTPIMNAALNCSRKVLRLMLADQRVDLYGRNSDGKGLVQLVNESAKHEAIKDKCFEMIAQAKRKFRPGESEQVTVIGDDNDDDALEEEEKDGSNITERENKTKGTASERISDTKRIRISQELDLAHSDENLDYKQTLYNLKCIRRSLNSLAKSDIQNDPINAPEQTNNAPIKQEICVDDEDVDREDECDEVEVDEDNVETSNPVNGLISNPVDVDIPQPLKSGGRHSLEEVRADIKKHYLDQIAETNVEIEKVEKTFNENIDITERKKLNLKEKYDLQRSILFAKSDESKLILEEKKSKLEKELAELQKSLSEVRHNLTKINQKVEKEDGEIQKIYKNEITLLEKEFEKENEDIIENLSDMKEKTKQLAKDLEKIVDVENNDNENNDSSNLEAAKETLECPICMELMCPPTRIWMCPSSHLVCEPCKVQLKEQPCPTCRIQRVTLRAFIAEKFAHTVFNNKNRTNGS